MQAALPRKEAFALFEFRASLQARFLVIAYLQPHSDEDNPTEPLPPSLQDEEDVAVKLKSNEVRIGPMTRASAELLKQQYEDKGSIARGGGEQLDMVLDMKTPHGRAREEREACTREEDEVHAGATPGAAGRHARSNRLPRRMSAAPAGSCAGANRCAGANWVTVRNQSRDFVRVIPVISTSSSCYLRCVHREFITTTVLIEKIGQPLIILVSDFSVSSGGADIVSWRVYESLRNEMRREFREQDEGLTADIEKVTKKLDTTNETVNTIQEQVTDIQRSLQALQLAVENMIQHQQQHEEGDSVHGDFDEQPVAVGRGVGNRGRGFVELGARCVPPQPQDDGLGKPKFSIPKFEGGPDIEEYLTWELNIEKLWRLHDYTEDRKIKLASSEFDGYALRWWDGVTRARQEDGEVPVLTWREMKAIMQAHFIPTIYLRSVYD
ncbi:hypothetical protein QYE76_037516 [Lolium multiflorum]|uniref:Retrotransposon gag domain-containing protein n=1 Tax=Lolium multiflorum TaxID=4521 RepID=A0AAD8VDF1_LOLMU|nr:hypothetical protein QYE76_037516 [Lolium multiflorum]